MHRMKIYMTIFYFIAMTGVGFAQGTTGVIIWRAFIGISKPFYVYKLSPDCALDGMREKLTTSGYSAQLWYSLAEQVDVNSLEPIPNLRIVTFTGSGFMAFPLKIDLQGTYGGDRVNLQFRVWENRNNSVLTWQQAVSDPSIAKGVSSLIRDYTLGGVTLGGEPILGDVLLQPEFTICAVPEPSTLALAALGVLGLALSLGHGVTARSE